MTRLTAVFLLVIVSACIWGAILLQPAPAANNAPAPGGFFDFPTQPTVLQKPEFTFMVGKPMTVHPNTMVCRRPDDMLAFWNTYDEAINVGNDDERRQAVTTALAASCQITQGVTFGIIVDDEQPSPASPDEFVIYRPNGDSNTYWVQAGSVDP